MQSHKSQQLLATVTDSDDDLGYVVIDTFVDGRSHGGVRIQPDVTLEQMAMLARTMTSKYRFLGLPFGGAKAGVIGDPEAPLEQRQSRLARFGKAIAPLLEKELFVPAADMGTDLEDIRHMLRAAGVHLQRRRLPPVSSGTYTAHSVFASLREMARFRGLQLAGLRVAIEGFGSVGSALAGLLSGAGAKVVAVSGLEGGAYSAEGLDIPALLKEHARLGSRALSTVPAKLKVDTALVPTLPADALCSCANSHSIHEGNATQVQARLLCPGANNPWTSGAEQVLLQNGATLLPEFTVNTGGILGTFMAYACFSHQETVRFVEAQFARSTRWLLEQSQTQGVSIRELAGRIASARRTAGSDGSRVRLGGWVLHAARSFHRRGLVPAPLVRAYARRYLRRALRLELTG